LTQWRGAVGLMARHPKDSACADVANQRKATKVLTPLEALFFRVVESAAGLPKFCPPKR